MSNIFRRRSWVLLFSMALFCGLSQSHWSHSTVTFRCLPDSLTHLCGNPVRTLHLSPQRIVRAMKWRAATWSLNQQNSEPIAQGVHITYAHPCGPMVIPQPNLQVSFKQSTIEQRRRLIGCSPPSSVKAVVIFARELMVAMISLLMKRCFKPKIVVVLLSRFSWVKLDTNIVPRLMGTEQAKVVDPCIGEYWPKKWWLRQLNFPPNPNTDAPCWVCHKSSEYQIAVVETKDKITRDLFHVAEVEDSVGKLKSNSRILVCNRPDWYFQCRYRLRAYRTQRWS